MEIKDIVEQEKHKRSLTKIKQREEKLTRKQFLKDCYKFWKEYKKVESPYFWWLGWFDWFCIFTDYKYLRWIHYEAPISYLKDSWFERKWKVEWKFGKFKINRKADPNSNYFTV